MKLLHVAINAGAGSPKGLADLLREAAKKVEAGAQGGNVGPYLRYQGSFHIAETDDNGRCTGC